MYRKTACFPYGCIGRRTVDEINIRAILAGNHTTILQPSREQFLHSREAQLFSLPAGTDGVGCVICSARFQRSHLRLPAFAKPSRAAVHTKSRLPLLGSVSA